MLLRLSSARFRLEMERVGAHPASFPIFERKHEVLLLKFFDLPSPGANVLKQEMLSLGGDVVVHKNAVDCKVERSDAILVGTRKHYEALVEKLRRAPYFGLPTLREELERYLKSKGRRSLKIPRGPELELRSPILIVDATEGEMDPSTGELEALEVKRDQSERDWAFKDLLEAAKVARLSAPKSTIWVEAQSPKEVEALAYAGADVVRFGYPCEEAPKFLKACAKAEVAPALHLRPHPPTDEGVEGRSDPLLALARLALEGLEEARSAGVSSEALVLWISHEVGLDVLLRLGELEPLGLPIAVDLSEAEGSSAEDESVLAYLLASEGVSFLKPKRPSAAKVGLKWHRAIQHPLEGRGV